MLRSLRLHSACERRLYLLLHLRRTCVTGQKTYSSWGLVFELSPPHRPLKKAIFTPLRVGWRRPSRSDRYEERRVKKRRGVWGEKRN